MTGSHTKMMRDETGQDQGNEHHECVPSPIEDDDRNEKGRPVGGPGPLLGHCAGRGIRLY